MIRATDILQRAAELFGVDLDLLLGTRRYARLTEPRQAVALALRRAGYSTLEIGDLMGRDHSTISYQVAAAAEREQTDPAFARKVAFLVLDQLPAPPTRAPLEVRPMAPATKWYAACGGSIEPLMA